ncbi:MAG: DUF4112 domain-containing protein [Alphaproteobacteria bacterium]|nr:DUF4112 domain-containing protein [Alphaproteobacteria bacterium]MBU0793423.1 DUF4112 domain-containing protein [Alphaproteobacteria bacterium]MBU0876986.1 DUF4112 domain-containing protein [Alphaproteobacteria bacterium]MBU1768412.1 DUF4112 domain-containing protein [Alphaproteobacteria bacterium]
MAQQFEKIAGSRLGRDARSVRQRVEIMEQVLENALVIPGTRFRIGLDAMVGIIPVVGDLLAAAMGAWIVWEARNLGLSRWQLLRMSSNVAIDTAIGAVPIVGDAFDIVFRSNSRNLRIIRKHLDKHHPETAIIEG